VVSVDDMDPMPSEDAWRYQAESDLELTISFGDESASEAPAGASAEGSRSLWVLARDLRGHVDSTPSSVTMTAASIAPEVVIDFPTYIPSPTCASASRLQTFGWTVNDPDATPGVLETRYILFPTGGPNDPCLLAFEPLPLTTDDPLWSNWAPYDPDAPTLDPSRSVSLPPQDVGNAFLFAVQARDATGATSTNLQWGLNVRHFRVSDGKFPLLTVQETSLGVEIFVAASGVKVFEVPANEPLSFSWEADASNYAGYVVGYRYGWSLADPDDPLDPGWAGPWGSATEAASLSFAQGSHNFVVQAMDNSGAISRATYLLPILQVPPRSAQRDVLLVIDWPNLADPIRDRWVDDLTRLVDELVFAFDPTRDVLDAEHEPGRLDLGELLDYRSVVWLANASELNFLHSRIAPLNSGPPRFNWLEVYQRSGGNFLLMGPGVAHNSIERNPPNWLFPIILDQGPGVGDLGWSPIVLPDGTTVNLGTLRWPYSGWCLTSLDIIRPAVGRIFGEQPGEFLRSGPYDQQARAEVSPEDLFHRVGAAGALVDLLPNADRLAGSLAYQLRFEEFYDRNVTSREVTVLPRDCQMPMFVHRAMRDEGYVDDPSLCPPPGSVTSVIDGAPVAIESSVYSEDKPLVGSHDFLWGFHPLGFEEEGLRAALRWVFLNDWELATAKR
jgi:hypothetical protein